MIVAKVSTSPPSSFEFLQTVRLQFFTVTPGDMIHLPIHGGEADLGSPASSSGASPPATEPSWSPTKIRRIANAGLPRLPLPRRVKDLPPLDTLQICHIVQRHAHACMLSGKYGDPLPHRVRCRTKRPVSVVELLEHIALMPEKGVVEKVLSWEERRRAGQFIASVYAQYTSVTVRQARHMLRDQWNTAPPGVKINACVLMNQTEHLPLDSPAASAERPKTHECYGCILTWQTRWGRKDDELAEYFVQNMHIDDLTELCRTLKPLKEAFDDFVIFVSDIVKELGMSFFSCAMELNSEDAAMARVHLHAFVCMNWADWGSPGFAKAVISPAKLEYQGMIPHPQPTRIGNRANPARALTGGLYYQLCPKIGSLFTASNRVLWKVRPTKRAMAAEGFGRGSVAVCQFCFRILSGRFSSILRPGSFVSPSFPAACHRPCFLRFGWAWEAGGSAPEMRCGREDRAAEGAQRRGITDILSIPAIPRSFVGPLPSRQTGP